MVLFYLSVLLDGHVLLMICLCFTGVLVFDVDFDRTSVILQFCFPSASKKTSTCAPMAESDRSRSPVPGRNRAEPRAPVPPVRQGTTLLSSMVWTNANGNLALTTNVAASVSTSVSTSVQFTTVGTLFSESIHQSKLSHSVGHMAKSTVSTGTSIVTSTYPGISIPTSSNKSTLLTYLATQAAAPSTPSIPSSQPRQAGTPYTNSPGGHTTVDDSRTYGFDLNPHWQEDKDHYDNQKINGLTFPRCIRQSAFTQKLDIEGCDPLKLPVAALLYQQANNFWLRKLAHGRELYLIPTGDIAAVVFMTELLTQLRNKGVDLDKVSSCKARQDVKLLDKTNNTKYAAQQTHIFTEVRSPQTGVRSLMVTEVDRYGVQHNRQPEFFFNGIVGHICADRYGWIDSWEQSTYLANYWRRHFNIPEVEYEPYSWHQHPQSPDNADQPDRTKPGVSTGLRDGRD